MVRINLNAKAIKFLQENSGQWITRAEITDWILKTYPDECQRKRERSKRNLDDRQFRHQITAELSPNNIKRNCPSITVKKNEKGRQIFCFVGNGSSDGNVPVDPWNKTSPPAKKTISELELYPLVATYLKTKGIRVMRLDEKAGSNNKGRGGNRWLYPDLVGIENLTDGYERAVMDCVGEDKEKMAKLVSVEVKIKINRSTVRESFFQAVSNSTWAHSGYLVTSEIHGKDTKEELQILNGLHGIGLIELDVDHPEKSQIVYSSHERGNIDWNTTNRICQQNKEFEAYLEKVGRFYKTTKLVDTEWL